MAGVVCVKHTPFGALLPWLRSSGPCPLCSEEERLDIARALVDLQVEASEAKAEADTQTLKAQQQVAQLSEHIEKLQHELEVAGQTKSHLHEKALDLAQVSVVLTGCGERKSQRHQNRVRAFQPALK